VEALMVNSPAELVLVPFLVPLTRTETPSAGVPPSLLVTFPLILDCWEKPNNQEVQSMVRISVSFFMIVFCLKWFC
jgi:hypothetical protein